MKIKLTKEDLRIANAANDEGGRPALEQVHIREGKIFAADGFMLVEHEVDIGKLEEPYYFPADLAKIARNGHIEVEIEEGKVRLSNRDYTIEAKLPEVTFGLDIDSLYTGEAKAVTALSISVLRKLLKALPESGTLKLRIAEPHHPVEFQVSNDGRLTYGLVMPLLTSWDSIRWKSDKSKDKPSKPKKKGKRQS